MKLEKRVKRELKNFYDKMESSCNNNDYAGCFKYIEIEKYRYLINNASGFVKERKLGKHYSLLSSLTTQCLQCKLMFEEGSGNIKEVVENRNIKLKICLDEFIDSFEP